VEVEARKGSLPPNVLDSQRRGTPFANEPGRRKEPLVRCVREDEGCHSEVETSHTQRHEAEQDGDGGACGDGDWKAERKGNAQLVLSECGSEGADTDKCSLCQRDLAHPAGQEHEGHAHDGVLGGATGIVDDGQRQRKHERPCDEGREQHQPSDRRRSGICQGPDEG